MQTIEADYLVIGAGAMGMAVVDALVSETQARVLLRLLAHPLGVVPIPGAKRAEYVRGERRRSRLPRRCLLAKPHCRRTIRADICRACRAYRLDEPRRYPAHRQVERNPDPAWG